MDGNQLKMTNNGSISGRYARPGRTVYCTNEISFVSRGTYQDTTPAISSHSALDHFQKPLGHPMSGPARFKTAILHQLIYLIDFLELRVLSVRHVCAVLWVV